ncbi:tubulin-specific chaperone cofactor E-like protein isoform X2 [Topomyia yanbarensis]|nr:tubulin-specific chaperone cofactor E-like protein isoform X2 [Topomyia yanbarensis]XP_058837084.1 tubulin-specific chaperone cofactor E-like protein isoform X2 [Topomyia yanbarensis]XP_058837085.1 tubulin-specific chaperone cofactor E-like protein isoform X2 [Topomyia yanbarensis]
MPTLLEALDAKYGLGDQREKLDEALVSIFVPKLPPRLSVPELLILNDCNIDKAGEPEDLRRKCCTVKELDLAQNKLENWDEVFGILSHMPRVEFVNLSLNRLNSPIENPQPCKMERLRSLVLNNTKLEWYGVETLLQLLPVLEELHLSLNEYTHVLIDTVIYDSESETESSEARSDNLTCQCEETAQSSQRQNRTSSECSLYKKTEAHLGVKKLHLTGNHISAWSEICRVGRLFPNLESLVLADCPIKSLYPSSTDKDQSNLISSQLENESHEHFRNLTLLNLSNAKIDSWDDIDRLTRFPVLKNLRVQCWPLWEKCDSTEHERRQLLIARLPKIEVLNGGDVIGPVEREDAERSFIRYYLDKPESDRPERYFDLIAVHGKLDPLVNIDLRPERKVKITFTYGDSSEERTVDVYRTVVDLKARLERIVGLPATKMRLFYVDQDLRDLQGLEEMKYPHKRLYSYNIRSGDEIIIDQKH